MGHMSDEWTKRNLFICFNSNLVLMSRNRAGESRSALSVTFPRACLVCDTMELSSLGEGGYLWLDVALLMMSRIA